MYLCMYVRLQVGNSHFDMCFCVRYVCTYMHERMYPEFVWMIFMSANDVGYEVDV